jgi:hypothetical protein
MTWAVEDKDKGVPKEGLLHPYSILQYEQI